MSLQNSYDMDSLQIIFLKYQISNKKLILKKDLEYVLIELGEFDATSLIDVILGKMNIDYSDNTEISLDTCKIFIENYFIFIEQKQKENEIFKNSFFSDYSKQLSKKVSHQDKQNKIESEGIIEIPNVDDVLKEGHVPDIDDILNDPLSATKKKFVSNDAIIDINNIPNQKTKDNNSNNENNEEGSPSRYTEKNSLLEESKFSHIVNIENIENKCMLHHLENENFCLNHLIYLCKICLLEKKDEHNDCILKNAKSLDILEIMENIYSDFKEFDFFNYQRIENFYIILEGLEEKKKNLGFDLIINSIKDKLAIDKIIKAKQGKQFIIEVAQIIFDKYLKNLVDIYNNMIEFRDNSRNLLNLVEDNLEQYKTSSNSMTKNEQSQIFQNFLKNNKALIKMKQDIQIYGFKHLSDIVINKDTTAVCSAIFNTIILHLSKIYNKLE